MLCAFRCLDTQAAKYTLIMNSRWNYFIVNLQIGNNNQHSAITALRMIYASNTHRNTENDAFIIGDIIVDFFSMQKFCTWLQAYTAGKRVMSHSDTLAWIPQCCKDHCWLLSYLLLTDRHFGILCCLALWQHRTLSHFPFTIKVSQAFFLKASFKNNNQ